MRNEWNIPPLKCSTIITETLEIKKTMESASSSIYNKY